MSNIGVCAVTHLPIIVAFVFTGIFSRFR